jgi:hypothetical protein
MPDNKVGAETKLEERPQSALRRHLEYYFAFPVVIDPFGKPYYRWQVIISTAVLYNIFSIPSRMAFQQLREPVLDRMWLVLDYTSDALYLIDIIWHLFIGKETSFFEAKPPKLRRVQKFKNSKMQNSKFNPSFQIETPFSPSSHQSRLPYKYSSKVT